MLRSSKAVTNLNEILNQAPEQDKSTAVLDTILSNPRGEVGESSEKMISYRPETSKAIAIPPAPVKKTSDDDLRGVSVFKYSHEKHQKLEQAKRDKCLAEVVFGYSRKF